MKQSTTALALFALCVGLTGRIQAASPQPLNLGTACGYAILAGSAITNSDSGSSVITGNIGSYPTGTENGLSTDTTINGVDYTSNAGVMAAAKADLATAYTNGAGLAATSIASELGGTTQTTGVYSIAAADLTGTLLLDAQGNTAAVFIFQTASTLTVASGGAVTLTNGAQAQNVFFVVGSSATLGGGATVQGTIIAQTAITVGIGSTITGGALAISSFVTFDTDTLNSAVLCAAGTASPTASFTPSASPTATQTATPTATQTGTATPSQNGSQTSTGTPTATETVSAIGSASPTSSPVPSSSPTATLGAPSATSSASPSATPLALQPVNLGTACGFAILAGTAITNSDSGLSMINGNIGTYPTGTENGLSTDTAISGTDYTSNAGVMAAAKADLLTAYNSASGLPSTTIVPELGVTTQIPGVYSVGSADLTGTLTLDAQGNTAAVFIFQTTAFTSAASSAVTLTNGARPRMSFS